MLHHAAEEPIFGLGMIEELARHGYRISPGSLYPLLHGLEKKGLPALDRAAQRQVAAEGLPRHPLGRKALAARKNKVRELFQELIEGD